MKKITYALIFALLVPYLFVTQPTVTSAKTTYRGAYSNLVDAQSQKEVRKALLDAGLSKKNVDAWLSDVKTYNKTIKNTGLVKKGFKKLGTKNPQYDETKIMELWNKKNPMFIGYNCRITAFDLMSDKISVKNLGQNFAKAFDVQYVNKEGKLEYVWATSWGVSTRLMGALIMAHSDNNGLVLPPKLAPIQVVMIPIYKGDDQLAEIRTRFEAIAAQLKAKGISVKIDDRDNVRSGFKFAEYELKGVPVRLAMGPRDMENGTIELVRRDTLEKQTVSQEGLVERIEGLMTEIQENIYRKALNYRESMITKVDTWEEFKQVLDDKGGFLLAHWDGTVETEVAIKEATKATIRCIPIDAPDEEGVCVFSGKPSHRRVLFARSY